MIKTNSGSPLCVPARTALITGMSAIRNGVTDLVAPHSLANSAEFGSRGWTWQFPADESEAKKVGEDYY